MPNHLRNIVMRPLRGELAVSDQLWDHTNASSVSDEDVWRDLEDIGTRTPVLVAYEDSYCGWYLAFANGGETQVIFLEPSPALDPDLPLRVPAELVGRVAADLASAFGEPESDILALLRYREELYVNGRSLADSAAWRRVLATLAAAEAPATPLILSEPVDAGRRYLWRNDKPKLVSHTPEPVERWKALRKLVPHDDPEALFREMYFSAGSAPST